MLPVRACGLWPVAGKREQATALGRGASARAAAEQGGVSVHGLCLPCRVLLLPALRLSLSRPLSRFFSRVPRRLRPGLRSPESRRRTGRRNDLNSPQTPRYEPMHVASGGARNLRLSMLYIKKIQSKYAIQWTINYNAHNKFIIITKV